MKHRSSPWKNVTALVCMLFSCTASAFSDGISEETAVETVSSAEPSGVAESTTAQATASPAATDAWHFLFAPYLWAPNTSGDLTLGPIQTDFALPFSTALDQLQGGFFGRFEARKSRLGIATDLSYVKVGKGGAFSVPLPGGGTTDGDLQLKLTFWELWPHYRIVDGNNVVDVFGGIRYNSFDTKATFNQFDRSADRKLSWVDPMFGARWTGQLSPKISLLARGDLAGFGAGSKLTFNVQGHFHWQFHPIVGLAVGYRWMDIDYEKEAFENPEFFKFDASMHGALFGITFAW